MEPNGELSTNPITPIKPKRGRRSKKDIELANAAAAALKSANNSSNNLFLSTTDVNNPSESDENQIKSVIDSLETSECENVVVKPPPKKRGRKPKGGKIVQQNLHELPKKEEKPNIILHLKCSMKDLSENSDFHMKNNTIESFTFGKNDLAYEVIESSYENPNMVAGNNNSCNFQHIYNIESNLLPQNSDNTTSIE